MASSNRSDLSRSFPNEPLWVGLIERAAKITGPVLDDTTLGIKVDLARLLDDVAHVRQDLWDSGLAPHGELISPSAPYIGLATSPNYEFYVAALAILSVGGAIVTLRPEISNEEELLVLKQCNTTTILTAPQQTTQCSALKALSDAHGQPLQLIPLQIASLNNAKSESTSNTAAAAATFQINTSQPIPPDSPALVIRTTGTTGTAKNVVHTRRLFYRTPPAQPDDLILIQQNLDWISGTVSILVRVLSGAKAEVLPTNPGPAAIWERLRRGGVTSLTDHSWFWVKLATYFQEHIETLPETERAEYVRGAQGLRWAFIVGTPPPLWLLGFWKEVFGCVLRVGYVATELGAVTLMTSADEEYIEGALGRPLPGMSAKLSEGAQGELLIKTPYIFSHYIGEPERTRKAFDEEGYFKTGDFVHQEGEIYVFDGRIGSDLMRIGSEQISLVRLDHELGSISNIAEICTLCIPGAPGEEKLGVLVRLHDQQNLEALQELKIKLSLRIGELPYLIRVLEEGDELPRTFNMKPFRRAAVKEFF